MSHPKNYRLRVGPYEFYVFTELKKFRWFSGDECSYDAPYFWDDEIKAEWKANLAKLKKLPALFPEDAKWLREAAQWMKRKGGDE
jgi:hypothetical protein